MRRISQRLTIVLAVALLAVGAPLAAQELQEEPREQIVEPSGVERTDPTADSTTSGSLLTAVGTVREFDGERLQLETSTGVEHIRITEQTQIGLDLEPGDEVAVDFTRTSQGVMIAEMIRPFEIAEEPGVDVTTATTTLDTSRELETDLDVEAEAAAELDTEAELDADFEADDELPATGSNLFLIALGGLLALGGAAGLRLRG